MVVEGLVRDVIEVQDQLNPRDTENLVLKRFNDQMPRVKSVHKISSTNIGDAFIFGHAVNGILGTANGEGGGQITLGEGDLGATTVQRVICDDKTFIEPLRDTSFVDTSVTTATIVTSSYQVEFTSSEIYQTESVSLNEGTITSALLTIPEANISPSTGAFTVEFTADGGSNWETASFNTTHTFTNTGTNLKMRITANQTATLSVRASGVDSPFKLKYTL